MVNPTFSLGIYRFANLRAFLREPRHQLHRPDAGRRRSCATGRSGCSAATCRTSSRPAAADAERRPALRGHDACRSTRRPRLGARDLTDRTRRRSGRSTRTPAQQLLAARRRGVGRVGDGTHLGSRRLRALLQHQQLAEPDRHGDQPAGDAARRHRESRRSRTRRSSAASGLSIRPMQWDIETPRVHVWNVNVQRELWRQHGADAWAMPGRAARTCCAATTSTPPAPSTGAEVCRSSRPARRGTNTASDHHRAEELATAIPGTARSSSICAGAGRAACRSSRPTRGRSPRTRRRPRRSSPTRPTARRRRFLKYIPDYNKGPSDFNAEHNWVMNATWDLPWGAT